MNTATHPRVLAEVLRAAAAKITVNGWWSGTYSPPSRDNDDPEQPCCAAGAINLVVMGNVTGSGWGSGRDDWSYRRRTSREATKEAAKVELLEHLAQGWEVDHEDCGDGLGGLESHDAQCRTYETWMQSLDEWVGDWNDAQDNPEAVTRALEDAADALERAA